MIRMPMRAYDARAGRQQGPDRLIASERELRNVLTDVLAKRNGAVIRLLNDVYITEPVKLAGDYAVVFDGGGRFGFRYAAGSTATTMFETVGNVLGIEFRSLVIRGDDNVSTLRTASVIRCVSGALREVDFVDCRLFLVGALSDGDPAAASWSRSSIERNIVDNRYISFATYGIPLEFDMPFDIGTKEYEGCYFNSNLVVVYSYSSIQRARVDNQPLSGGIIAANVFINTVPANYDVTSVSLQSSPGLGSVAFDSWIPNLVSETITTKSLSGGDAWRKMSLGNQFTTDATVETIATILTTSNTNLLVEVRISAQNATGNTGVWVRRFRAKNVASVVSIFGATTDYTNQSLAWPGPSEDVFGTNIRIRVQGAVATTIEWAAAIDVTGVA